MYYISWIEMIGLSIPGFILGYLYSNHFIPYLKKIRKDKDVKSDRGRHIRLFLNELEGYLERMYVDNIFQKSHMDYFMSASYAAAHEIIDDTKQFRVNWVGNKTHYTITVEIDELVYELKALWDMTGQSVTYAGITFYPVLNK